MRAPRLNISQASPDATLQQVQDRIDGEWLVTHALGPDGVEGVLDAHARCATLAARARGVSLDLIAHARRGVLQLGSWTVDGQGASGELHRTCAGILAELELRAIRLLGCNTALTTKGQDAMRRLHALFGVPVFGTKVPISARDFDATGFLADAVLTNQDHLPPIAPPNIQSSSVWRHRFGVVPPSGDPDGDALRLETMAEVLRDWTQTLPALRWPIRELDREAFDAVIAAAEPVPAWAPGLLALPELEIVAPSGAEGARRFHRLTVLLDGFWLRIYPRGRADGVLLHADGDERLFDALAQGTAIALP